ncbi:MAG: rhodanese-like domain-containing protein [Phycisphaerae bacterium]|nr:rhodanese-like domain-containing protein [Phycisphaerae bacterium]
MAPTSLLTRALAVFGVAVLIGAAHSARTPVALRLQPTEAQTPATTPDAPETPPRGPGLMISVGEAFELFQQGTPFLDARPKADFDAGRVMGAFHNPPSTGLKPDVIQFLDPSRPIVIYCGGGDCKDSENLAILLQQMGFNRLHVMTDGFPAWQSAGHPVEGGGGP